MTTLPPTGAVTTRLAVQGSTGGAGLRGLEGDKPMPLVMSVLYLGADHQLQAYDDIQVGGAGTAQVSLNRKVIDAASSVNPAAPSATPADN
ncbi:hypothetical protein GAR05_01531 [Micromonospora saelicesensis]|uniref:Uncharacterized protein n=1 Tax=Micromonospora saelicesensis TaxID=285676 RepID=A0ABX9CMA5_9ACTN|nr:hypothetical protein GAR05_01531 [Micromonospora saelicesensis]